MQLRVPARRTVLMFCRAISVSPVATESAVNVQNLANGVVSDSRHLGIYCLVEEWPI
jgi:hypothetical protein